MIKFPRKHAEDASVYVINNAIKPTFHMSDVYQKCHSCVCVSTVL